MDDIQRFDALKAIIKKRVPDFQIKFKDESPLMKLLGKLMFFNKSFMTTVTTVICKTVYFPSRATFEKNRAFKTLCHEYVHIYDYVENPVGFILGYIFPQILVKLSCLAVLSVFNLWFLLFLLALLFAAPIPAPLRTKTELRGYGMSLKVREWLGEEITTKQIKRYVGAFTTSTYYFMCPFAKYVEKKLQSYLNNDSCLSEPVYKEVYDLVHL